MFSSLIPSSSSSSKSSAQSNIQPNNTPLTADAMTKLKSALESVPWGMQKELRPRGKGRKTSRKEMNKALGNDDVIPWTRVLRDRSVVMIVGNPDPVSLLNTSITVPTFASAFFTGGSLDNFSNLALVFDEYHIAEIEVLIQPTITESVNSGSNLGMYVTAVDIDDASTPSTIAQVGSYASSTQSSGTASHYHRWKPTYSVATYSGAFTSYSTASGWIDAASPAVQHYGLKIASSSTSVSQGFTLLTRMTVMFRGLH